MEQSPRHIENNMMFPPEYPTDAPAWVNAFLNTREDLLVDYKYNTARAYWADLDDWLVWALERDKNVLELTEAEVRQYLALLRRRRYSEGTVRRRITALRLLYKRHAKLSGLPPNPTAAAVNARKRR